MHGQLRPLHDAGATACDNLHLRRALHACGRDKELAAVKISAADVQLIAREVEVDPKVADRRLRESGGNVFNALVSFL